MTCGWTSQRLCLGASECTAQQQQPFTFVYVLKDAWGDAFHAFVHLAPLGRPLPHPPCSKEIEVSRLEDCSTCSGTGVKAGTSASTCGTCKGGGQVVQAVRTPLGMFQQVATCPACSGTGEQFTPCSTCQGDGRVR